MSLIRTEAEYREAQAQLARAVRDEQAEIDDLRAMGLTPEEIHRVLAPARSMLAEIQGEVEWYERAQRGQIQSVSSLENLGPVLIALRIHNRWSQHDLAQRVGVSDAQVSRDEKNEYHGITLERAQRLIDVLGATVAIQVDSTSGWISQESSRTQSLTVTGKPLTTNVGRGICVTGLVNEEKAA